MSVDDLDSHREFAKKHDLTFPLLADTNHELAKKFGVETKRGFAERVTFVIDRKGIIAKVYPRVRVTGHAEDVLAFMKTLPKK